MGCFPPEGNPTIRPDQRLQPHEAQSMKQDPVVQARLMRSYKMMLELLTVWSFLMRPRAYVDKAPRLGDQVPQTVNRSLHNSMRITRILKSLGEVGLEHLKYPAGRVPPQASAQREDAVLDSRTSLLTYWVHTIRSDDDRRFLLCVAEAVDGQVRAGRWTAH
uniref:Putative opioid growth factor receptor n=1 Tax=Ixodes ricinus TaxID=34613 RepID=A0A090XA96_IXORI